MNEAVKKNQSTADAVEKAAHLIKINLGFASVMSELRL